MSITRRSYIPQVAAALLLGLVAPVSTARAQDAYPVVEVRQITGTGGSTWASSARVSLDRDAFVVVFELGVDGRARILYPASPRDNAFMLAERSWYVPLPSVDAMFVQTSAMQTPALVAFASDVAPDLSEFTGSGRAWDYMFSVPGGAEREMALRGLATLLYGDPEMPYSVSESRIAPLIPLAAQRALTDCGYRVGAYGSAQFMDFLWDVFGPFAMFGTQRTTLAPWRSNNFVQAFDFPLGIWGNFSPLAFTRFTSNSLWNRFGAGCSGLQQLGFNQIAVLSDQVMDSLRALPVPPTGGPRGPHGTTEDTGIDVPGSAGAAARANRLRSATAATESAKTAAEAPATDEALTRETNRELMQRAEVRALVARLAIERASGAPTVAMNQARWDALRAAQTAEAQSNSAFRRVARGSASGGSGPSGLGVGGGSGSVGGASSGGASGGSAGSAGSAGSSSTGRSSGGRGGSGRGNPFL